MKRILGLDPGAHFGWAVIESDGDAVRYVAGGTKEHRLRSKDPKAKRWADCSAWIASLLAEHRPDDVNVESVRRHAGVLAAHAYGFYRYTAEARCYEAGIPCRSMEVSEWKKAACGVGKGRKDSVAAAVAELFPDVEIQTDDHSDAIGIAIAGLRTGPEELAETRAETKRLKAEKRKRARDASRA